MTASTSVKWAVSSMVGAPTLNGTAGSLIAVLDAFLVNGFGAKAVDSAQVTGGVCRLAITGASAAVDHCVIQLAGVTGDGVSLNGPQRVLAATASYVDFACDLPDGPLSGAITFKIASLGWDKVFSASNIAVYRSPYVASTRAFLRVDDSNALNARVIGYESMTSANDGLGPFPTNSQVAGGGYWPKANAANTTARAWSISGDSKSFVLRMHTATTSIGVSGCIWGFGDIESLKAGDANAAALFCATSALNAQATAVGAAIETMGTAHAEGPYIMRSFTGVGGAVRLTHGTEAFNLSGVAGTGGSAAVPSYPNPADNSLIFTRKVLSEPGVCLRGRLRGVHFPAQACYQVFHEASPPIDSPNGRKLLAMPCGAPAGTTSAGVLFVDITGPWE